MGKRVEQYAYLSFLGSLLIATLKSIRMWLVLVVLVDFLFYAGAFGIATLAKNEIKANYDALNFPDPSLQQQISGEEAASMLAQMKSFRNATLALLGAAAIAIIAWWSVCKGIIWSITLKEKLKASSVWRFFMLNLAWLGCWMLLLSVLAYVMNFVQAKYFLVVIIAFFIVLTNSIYSLFIATPNWKSVKDALYLTFRRFHRFVLSYILLWLMFFVIAKASSVFSHIAFSIITLIVLLIYVAIARAYVSRMVLEEYTLYSGELAGAHLNIRALKKS